MTSTYRYEAKKKSNHIKIHSYTRELDISSDWALLFAEGRSEMQEIAICALVRSPRYRGRGWLLLCPLTYLS